MKKLIIPLTISAALLTYVGFSTIKPLRDHTFRISGYAYGQLAWTCSAVAINSGEAITAGHCVIPLIAAQGSNLVELRDDHGNLFKVSAIDRFNDVAIISGDFTKREYVELSREMPQVGQKARGCGFPGGTEIKRCTGGTISIIDGYSVRFNGSVLPGMSGGPVFDEQGKLVGIISLMYPGSMGGGAGFAHVAIFNR